MTQSRSVEVAIVGGGPAGAAIAARLVGAGVETVVFERWPAPRWRASGVYSSPATRGRLAALGLPDQDLDALIRPIDAMEVVGPAGTVCRLAYGPPDHACGLDRVRLERVLLDRARVSGAQVLEGVVVRRVEPAQRGGHGTRHPAWLEVSTPDGQERWRADLVIGADGPGSMVARAHGVDRPVRRSRRAGLTVHRADPEAAPPGAPMAARMTIGRGWYCGVAPVPDGRVNIGIVMGERDLAQRLHGAAGPGAVIRGVTDALPGPVAAWQACPETDRASVALPLAHRVARRAGPGFLLVGDAAGFVDPLSGEGLHRALISAELAEGAVLAHRRGDPDALDRYDRRMRARFAPRDLVSWLLQLFLARPGMLEYALARLARRDGLRRTFGDALADLEPASRILAPRYLLNVLRP